MFMNRGKMNKKDMIKAMLAKTKVGDSLTTSSAATGQVVKHFQPSK